MLSCDFTVYSSAIFFGFSHYWISGYVFMLGLSVYASLPVGKWDFAIHALWMSLLPFFHVHFILLFLLQMIAAALWSSWSMETWHDIQLLPCHWCSHCIWARKNVVNYIRRCKWPFFVMGVEGALWRLFIWDWLIKTGFFKIEFSLFMYLYVPIQHQFFFHTIDSLYS